MKKLPFTVSLFSTPRSAAPTGLSRPAAPVQTPASMVPAGVRPASHRDSTVDSPISTIAVAGHLTYTTGTVTAWYTLREQQWAFRPDAARQALLDRIADQVAALGGMRLHLRRTTRPFPAEQWSETLDRTVQRPLPNRASWWRNLGAAQQHIVDSGFTEGQTMLGVTFSRKAGFMFDLQEWVSRRTRSTAVRRTEHEQLIQRVRTFDAMLADGGMGARPATEGELTWLLDRSISMFLAPPARSHRIVMPEDILALTERSYREYDPFDRTVRITDRYTGETRHVAVLTVGYMEPQVVPEQDLPWLHLAASAPFPVEISSTVDVLRASSAAGSLGRQILRMRSQQRDYADHGLPEPLHLQRLLDRGMEIEDQMSTGRAADACRVHGWHRLAVSGATEEECLERARKLTSLYAETGRIELHHPKGQPRLAAEFIPGEPLANTAYLRRMPGKLFAMALPQAASGVGDRRGDLIGHTVGAGTLPVLFDPHFPMEVRDKSGLVVMVSEPGGGKSTLLGGLAALAARRGVQVTLVDPSGPLARLAGMPIGAHFEPVLDAAGQPVLGRGGRPRRRPVATAHLSEYTQIVDLDGSAPGTLNPYSLIPTPDRREFEEGVRGDRKYSDAIAESRAERREFVIDIITMLIPAQDATAGENIAVLRDAVRRVPAEASSTLDDVVALLLQDADQPGDHAVAAKIVANRLIDQSTMPRGCLFFGHGPDHSAGRALPLTIITMPGLRLPEPGTDRRFWTAREQIAVPMLHAAHRLAALRCYSGDMKRRKMIGLDEAHVMQDWASGKSLSIRLARDSRKFNLCTIIASQNPKDILGLEVQNLVSTVFVGRIADDEDVAREALKLLRVPTGIGYEATLASLSQAGGAVGANAEHREFVMRDVDGNVQRVAIDFRYIEHLMEYLNTTPGVSS